MTTLRASDGRPDDPFNGQCPVDDVPKKYPAACPPLSAGVAPGADQPSPLDLRLGCLVAAAREAELVKAAEGAMAVFLSYAKLHQDKGTPAGDQKAKRNWEEAEALRAALSETPIDRIQRLGQECDRADAWRKIETAPDTDEHIWLLWGDVVALGSLLDNSHTSVPWKGYRPIGMVSVFGQPTHWAHTNKPSPPTQEDE